MVVVLCLQLRPAGGIAEPDTPAPVSYAELRLVSGWEGSITERREHGFDDRGPAGTYRRARQLDTATATVHFELVERDASSARYTGTATGTAQTEFSESSNDSCVQIDIKSVGAGSIEAVDGRDEQEVTLTLDFERGTYLWFVSGTNIPSTTTERCAVVGPAHCQEPGCGQASQTRDGSGYSPGFGGSGALPRDGTALTGRRLLEGDVVEDTWTFRAVTAQVELIIDPIGYEDWMPEAGASQFMPGPHPLEVRATLQKRGGGAPPVKARFIRFELVDTSTLPGLCNNAPAEDARVDPDLMFEESTNLALDPRIAISGGSETGLQAQSTGAPHITASARISAFDWGGHGTLLVRAALEDGSSVTGHLRDGGERVLIPKRSGGSRIADRWRRETGATGADDWDEEDEPDADPGRGGHKGDGLTLFEEYRGFRERTVHFRGDPRRKEMFIVDRLGGSSKAGIRLLQGITALRVHHRLLHEGAMAEASRRERDIDSIVADECPGAQQQRERTTLYGWVVNFNNGRAAGYPGRTDKQAIGLEGHTLAFSFAAGDVGQPRTVYIGSVAHAGAQRWQAIRVGRGSVLTDTAASVIAHELGHAASVRHHGECDRVVQWRRGPGGALIEHDVQVLADDTVQIEANGSAVTLEWEGGGPIGPDGRFPTGLQWLGVQRGMHSGQEDCVMRYNTATAYVPAGRPAARVLIGGDEMSGVGLCSSPVGAGVNMPGRQPQPRYGDAAKGDCRAQLCVNDEEAHP